MSLERSFPTVNVLRRNPNSPGYSCETASDASHPLSMGDRNAPLPPAPVGRGTSGIPSGPLRPLPRLPPPLNFQSLVVLPTLSHTAFAQATIHPQDWHFVAACQATLLDGLGSVLRSRITSILGVPLAPPGGGPARWAGTSVSLAAQAWKLSQCGIAKCGGKVRYLRDLRWLGANQAIANPGLADVLGICPLCGHGICSQTHILCNCPGVAAERASLHHDLTLLVARILRGPRRTLLGPYEPGIANRGQL